MAAKNSGKKKKMLPFTVTVAGPERHAGEKPYTYVLDAASADAAGNKIVVMFKKEQGDEDVVLVSVVEGVPGPNDHYHWNNLRKAPMCCPYQQCLDIVRLSELERGAVPYRCKTCRRRFWSEE